MRSDRSVGEEPTSGIHFLLDEAANYATAIEEPLGELIREGRKFGAFCTLITQTPNSLSPSLRSLLIDVVGTMCLFSQGPQQAENLASWVNNDDFPKVVVRTLLMQAKPGEALLLRQGHTPCRMQALNTPFPKVEADKVRALRRAALAHWGSPPRQETFIRAQEARPEASQVRQEAPQKDQGAARQGQKQELDRGTKKVGAQANSTPTPAKAHNTTTSAERSQEGQDNIKIREDNVEVREAPDPQPTTKPKPTTRRKKS
jgi:hypothetical protein